MTPTDFTNPDVFFGYLSGFWAQAFADGETLRGLSAGDALQLAQLHRDFQELVRASAVAQIAPLHAERPYPLLLRRSRLVSAPQVPTYGEADLVYDGRADYGVAPANFTLPYYPFEPAELAGLRGTLVNRTYDPSVVWLEGVDWWFEDNRLFFRTDPFTNPLLARRSVQAADGSPDELLCLFALDARLERGDLQRRYGYAFFDRPPVEGEAYRLLLAALMRLYSGGPTVAALDTFFAVASGLPTIREARESVECVLAQPDGGQAVVTDQGIYAVPAGLALRPEVVPGATLRAGAPLCAATRVWDHLSAPSAFLAQPGFHVGANFLVDSLEAGLGFPGRDEPVDPGDDLPTAQGPRRAGRFALVGRPGDLERYWAHVRTRSLESGTFLADTLWRQAGLVDRAGDPDYTQDVFVNPGRFLFENFLGEGTIGVSLAVPPTPALLASLARLRDALPATRTLLLFVTPGYGDDWALTLDPAVAPDLVTIAPVDERLALRGADRVQRAAFAAPGALAHAAGYAEAPDLLVDTLDLGDSGVVFHTAGYRMFPACG